MSEKVTWWERLCMAIGLTWEAQDAPPAPAPSAALPSTPPVLSAQNIYAREARLQDLKMALHRATGVQLQELSYDHEIEDALTRGDAIIVEVAAGTEAITIHALPPDDLDGFGSLAAWSAWQTSGREEPFDAVFYRLDVEPVESSRESLREGATPPPNLQTGIKRDFEAPPAPSRERDDNDAGGGDGDDGEAGGPVKARPGPGDEPPPPPAQVRAPRSR